MSNKETINKAEWEEYRFVQDSGLYNMYDPNARAMTTLSRSKWLHIMKNYSELKTKYEGGDNA